MSGKVARRFPCILLALGLAVALLPAGPARALAGEDRVIVEIQGECTGKAYPDQEIKNTNNLTRQEYKYRQERYGDDFHYLLSGLSKSKYSVEFSFFEPHYTGPGQRVFTVYANGTALSGLTNLDIYSKAGGMYTAYQKTVNVNTVDSSNGRQMDLRFAASTAEATVSNIRLISGGETALEINVLEDRNFSALPLRFINGEGQNLHEVVLGRMGSRFMVNPVPQLLAWRQSPLGTWTADLSELALAFRDSQGDIRCLPFTDRYPVFSSIDQSLTLTGVSYVCRDPALPFQALVTLTAPFYPQEVKLSSAPFVYLDITVKNLTGSSINGDFLLVQPHKDDAAPVNLEGPKGYKFYTRYTYGDASYLSSGGTECWEALAVDNGAGVDVYTDITPVIWPSPSGYPLPYAHQVYTFKPRGYAGLKWGFNLSADGSAKRTVVLAGHTDKNVLTVQGARDYRFLYNRASGPVNLTSVDAVVDYALDSRAAINQKTDFFNSILSDTYISGLSQPAKDLMACALQSFLCNTWWCYKASEPDKEWFSVWEGNCFFHSTVDVEYNDAWFYLSFWPDRLKVIMQEWILFQKSNAQGKYLSHDMGVMNWANGMAYPHDMPVEENADYVLLMYGYWKTTGDEAFMKSEFAHVKDYTRFIFNCDTDGDGMPDLNTANTIDQGSAAIQNSRNQTYLGVKALSAYRAAEEMARAQGSPDQNFIKQCEERVRLLNTTLGDRVWLGDHFAVCTDYSVPPADREAYSIYASNGLLYLLAAGLETGVTASNLDRLRTDITTAAETNLRRYGYVHTSRNNENQWVSQNLWRDALGYWLDVGGWEKGNNARLAAYWNLQEYYARKKNGGFWDVCVYNDFNFLGSSEAAALGFSDSASANAYLEQARLEGGGVRGAYALDSAFHQSLRYYPRGTASLAMVNAMAGLRVDLSSGYLLYDPAAPPGRVPVLACADWANQKIPVLVFNQAGDLQQVLNSTPLLPGNIKRSREDPITGLKAQPFSCSPGMEGARQQVTVSYNAPPGSIDGALILSGGETVRELTPGASGVSWDGKNASGQPLPDGTYTLYLETDSPDPAVLTSPDTVEVGVNTDIPTPSDTWYLAEGYTGSNATGGEFETWVLVQNPNDAEAGIKATFMQPGGATTERDYLLPPHSRFTIYVDDILPDAQVSTRIQSSLPVVVERAVYFNGRNAGHDTVGATSPSNNWYLAEGYTGGDFDEWILIQNPGDSTADINVHFQPQDQDQVSLPYSVGPHSRFTIHVDDILPDAQVSTYVQSDQPVVVERAQYLKDMRSGTCSIGARSPSRSWYFAEGYTGGSFEEWLLVQNPQDQSSDVYITFMDSNGDNTSIAFNVPPHRRYTVAVDELLPDSMVSAGVLSDLPVVAERAMYWEERSDGHDTLGTPCPEYDWFFAEGYTAGGFEEWLLIQNPWDEQAEVSIEFMLPGGSTQSMGATVGERSRYTLDVGATIGPTEVSIKVSSDLPVVSERAMYFNRRSGGHCSIGAIE